jgi:hypothetical protein
VIVRKFELLIAFFNLIATSHGVLNALNSSTPSPCRETARTKLFPADPSN